MVAYLLALTCLPGNNHFNRIRRLFQFTRTLLSSIAQLFAKDVVALLDLLGISSANIVGFSDGGCTGLQLAIHHPRKVRKLILLGTPFNTSNYPQAIQVLFPVITSETLFQIGSPALLEAIRAAQPLYDSNESWQRFFVKLVNGMWAREPNLSLDELARVTVPTLILHAEKEEFYSIDASQEMARSLSAELKVVPGASHMSAQDNPAFVNVLLLEFLSRTPTAGRAYPSNCE